MFSILGILLTVVAIGVQLHLGAAWLDLDLEHTIQRKETPSHFWTIIGLEILFGVVANTILIIYEFGLYE